MTNIHLISFADKRLWPRKYMFLFEAIKFNSFKSIRIYNEDNLETKFKEKYSDILNKKTKGFGYWIWKSEIIKNRLNEINSDEILIYLDIGSTINFKGKKTFNEYIKKLNNSKNNIIGCRTISKSNFEKYYTSEDTFKLFKIPRDSIFRETPQYEAGFILIKKSRSSINLINHWNNLIIKNIEVLKGETFTFKNCKEFIDHRQDQSFLSLMFKQNNVDSIPGFYFYKNILIEDLKSNKSLFEKYIFVNDGDKPFLHTRKKIWGPSVYLKKIINCIMFKKRKLFLLSIIRIFTMLSSIVFIY